MKIEELKNYKKILILGYGVEGKATEEFLKKHHPEAQITIADKTDGDDYLEKQDEADLVIKTPSISSKLVTRPYTTGTNIFFANTKAMTIGITGTKGKSTTASLAYHILKNAGKDSYLAGNIGKPMIELLDHDLNRDDLVVLELSSYQLEDIEYSPHIAVLLNIYKELHNHESFESYKQAKFNIVRFSTSADYYIYNPVYEEFAALKTSAHKTPFQDLPANFETGKLIGDHNRDNIKAAYTIASITGVVDEIVQKAVVSYAPLDHRMQTIGQFQGITFINDSAATHPSATVSAMRSYTNIGTLIVGGQERGYDIRELIHTILEQNIENIALFPDTGERIVKELERNSSYQPRILLTSSMEDAVNFAYRQTKPGSVCLFSPGFPSYISFKNFVERGEKFVYYVVNHAKTEKSQAG